VKPRDSFYVININSSFKRA